MGDACPTAPDAIEQKLVCNVGIVWHGGSGAVGDDWSFEPEYVYSMANLIEDSPSKPWRSETDNADCSIVIDMGANVRHYADGVGFFGSNVRQLNLQMHTADSWALPTGPDTWERVDFNIDGREPGVYVTAGATASIAVADDNNVDFGTGNFTLVWRGTLADYTPAADAILMQKTDGTNGWIFQVDTTGVLQTTS
jgi:hypothetical protein